MHGRRVLKNAVCLLLTLYMVGCASSTPDTAVVATSDLKSRSKSAALAAQNRALQQFCLLDSDRSRSYVFNAKKVSGELAKTVATPFSWTFDEDEYGRLVWQPGDFEIIFKAKKDELYVQELLFGVGRIVTDLKVLQKSAVNADFHEGLFLFYKSDQTEEVNGRGEARGTFFHAGQQQLKLVGGSIETDRQDLTLEFEFEEAVEVVTGEPKVSSITLYLQSWHTKSGVVYLAFRLTAGRGPVSINLLDFQGEAKR